MIIDFDLRDIPAIFRSLLRKGLSEKLIRSHHENNYTGSVILHEYYFGNLGGDVKPGGGVLEGLKQAYGSTEQWETEFRRTTASLAGGSGWAMLAYNMHTGELHNYWAWDHMHNALTSVPLLVLDMYEHSFHMDYGAAAARYIDAFMLYVN